MADIGQLRRNEIASYFSPVSYTIGTVLNDNITISDIYDRSFTFSNDNVLSNLNTYYLTFSIKQDLTSTKDFDIVLSNTNSRHEDDEIIGSYNIKQGTNTLSFELIFTPNDSYDLIIFRLKRNSTDLEFNKNKIIDFESSQILKLTDIISSYLRQKFSGLTTLKKIGVQGPPGLLMAINGEEIHIGRSGIYELYNDEVDISSMSFVIKDSSVMPDGKDYFIMDFKY